MIMHEVFVKRVVGVSDGEYIIEGIFKPVTGQLGDVYLDGQKWSDIKVIFSAETAHIRIGTKRPYTGTEIITFTTVNRETPKIE